MSVKVKRTYRIKLPLAYTLKACAFLLDKSENSYLSDVLSQVLPVELESIEHNLKLENPNTKEHLAIVETAKNLLKSIRIES